MAIKLIDLTGEDIDFLSREKAEHRALVLEEALEDLEKFVEEHGISLTGEETSAKVRLPLKKEYRLCYNPPLSEGKNDGIGQSAMPQQGENGQNGRDGDSSGKDKQNGENKSSSDQPDSKNDEGQGEGDNDGEKKKQASGSGRKSLKRGQVIGELPRDKKGSGSGSGKRGGAKLSRGKGDKGASEEEGGDKAGTEPGEDTFETEIKLQQLREAYRDELHLPDLKEKSLSLLRVKKKRRPYGYRRRGPAGQLSGSRSAEERLKRISATGGDSDKSEDEEMPFIPNDLRYRRRDEDVQYLTNALVVFIRDVSGSMDENKRKIVRGLSLHIVQAIRKAHPTVELVFITHHTAAQERDEWEFLHLGGSGGTTISSGTNKALEIIRQRYSPDLWNIFTMVFTDGENEYSDAPHMLESFETLCKLSTLFGYFEVLSSSSLSGSLAPLAQKYPQFVLALIKRQELTADAFNRLIEAAEKRRRDEER